MSNFPYIPTPRTIYVSTNGSDLLNGSSPQYAVKTLAKARELAIALNPVLDNQVAILALDYNRFVENLDIPDNVQILMIASTIVGNITAGENGQCQIGIHVVPSGIGYSTNGKNRTGYQALSIICLNFAPCTAISIDSTSDETFIQVNQILLRADNSTGVSYTSSGSASEAISVAVIDIGDKSFTPNNCRGVYVNDGSADSIFFRGGKILDNGGTGNVGVWIDAGKVVDEGRFINMTSGNQAILLNGSDADYTIDSPLVNGDILTLIGSYLAVNINRYTIGQYSAFILGDADGYIGGVKLGTYVEGDEDTYSFQYDRVRNQENSIGTFKIDNLALKEIKLANIAYDQSSNANIFTNVSIVDAATATTVYYSISNNETSSGFSGFKDMVAATPLPASGDIELRVICNKSGGGATAIQDLSVNVTVDKK